MIAFLPAYSIYHGTPPGGRPWGDHDTVWVVKHNAASATFEGRIAEAVELEPPWIFGLWRL